MARRFTVFQSVTVDMTNPKGTWFTLKEGSHYRLKFSFKVSNNIVSGLRYTNTVWKTGVKVDSTKEMLGVFSPHDEPYTHKLPEETTPSGLFARGSYSARTKAANTSAVTKGSRLLYVAECYVVTCNVV